MTATWIITKDKADNIEGYLKGDRFVEAIKEFRSRTGAGLKESKSVIDHLRDTGDWPKIVTIKGEVEEELVASTSLPPKIQTVEHIRGILCETLRRNVGKKEINCGTMDCTTCSLSPQSQDDDFLINLINLPLNKE